MNETRRRLLRNVIFELEGLQVSLSDIRDLEQEAFDNLPEGLQCSDKGEAMEYAVEHIDEADSRIEDAVAEINEAIAN
jgi:hypothetical protein